MFKILTLGCKDIGIRKFKFVVKTQFLWPRQTIKKNCKLYSNKLF